MWELEYSKKSYAIHQHYRRNKPLTGGLKQIAESEPELERFEDFYLKAFGKLVTERGAGPVIPYTKIRQYGEESGLDPVMMEVFPEVIWELDSAHSSWQREEQKRRLDK